MQVKPTTRVEYEQRIGRAIRQLQASLDEPLDLEGLAKAAHFSPFHFHRLFTAMVGETVGGYQRRLRLERAASKLGDADDQVIRVALEAGFESHEAFTRAFKAHFGYTPSEYRKLDEGERRAVLTRPRPMFAGPATVEVEVRKLAATRYAYISRVGPYMSAGQAFGEIYGWAMANQAWDGKSVPIGVYYDDPSAVAPEKLRFEAGLPVVERAEGSGAVKVRIIPGGDHAIAVHKGPYWRLGETYTMLYSRWLPDSGRDLADRPCVERYLNNPREAPETELLTEVCVPLE